MSTYVAQILPRKLTRGNRCTSVTAPICPDPVRKLSTSGRMRATSGADPCWGLVPVSVLASVRVRVLVLVLVLGLAED